MEPAWTPSSEGEAGESVTLAVGVEVPVAAPVAVEAGLSQADRNFITPKAITGTATTTTTNGQTLLHVLRLAAWTSLGRLFGSTESNSSGG
jgi:hypothetical protein